MCELKQCFKQRFKPTHAQKQGMKRASMEKSAERNRALLEHFEKTMVCRQRRFLRMKFQKRRFVS